MTLSADNRKIAEQLVGYSPPPSTYSSGRVEALMNAARHQGRGMGDWRAMETAPKDGTPILAFCVHTNYDLAPPEDKDRWTEIVLTRWIDHNGGGWTWHGLCSVHRAWTPLPAAPGLSGEEE